MILVSKLFLPLNIFRVNLVSPGKYNVIYFNFMLFLNQILLGVMLICHNLVHAFLASFRLVCHLSNGGAISKIKKNKDNLRNGTLLITHVANFSENQPTQVQMSVRPSQTIVFNLHKSLKTLDSLVKATKTG